MCGCNFILSVFTIIFFGWCGTFFFLFVLFFFFSVSFLSSIPTLCYVPAPVAQWLARRTVGRKVWGSNPIRVMWDFSALAGSYPELGVLWAQWEGWNHTAELHPLNGCVFEGVALIT